MLPPAMPESHPSPVPPSTSGARTSLSLLARLRDRPNSAEAWNRLDAIYRPLLRRWSTRWDLQAADADNLVQTVLVELSERLPTFHHNLRPGAFRAWLRKILGYRILEFQHGKIQFWKRNRSLAAELEDPESSITQLLDREHDEHLLRCAREYLARTHSERDAKVFELAVAHEMKAADIAARFGITRELVWQIKSRLLKELREVLRGLVELD